MPASLTVYIRHGCHLCDDMVAALATVQAELGFAYRLCDVDADPRLASRYGDRVPVLTAGDTELCHYFLELDRLREYCRSA